jgi:guanylate kinase
MGKIFYMMGKSSSGKDTIYENLLHREELALKPVVIYTTRPKRAKELEGVQYHFVSVERMHEMQQAGQVIELRSYDTVQGIWYYFTADDESIDLEHDNYLMLGTLESYRKMRDYYGAERVVPIYIEVEDGERLRRAMVREKKQPVPQYEEMCRRFLADQKDFSEEKIREAGITRRFTNNEERSVCMEEVSYYIKNAQ